MLYVDISGKGAPLLNLDKTSHRESLLTAYRVSGISQDLKAEDKTEKNTKKLSCSDKNANIRIGFKQKILTLIVIIDI